MIAGYAVFVALLFGGFAAAAFVTDRIAKRQQRERDDRQRAYRREACRRSFESPSIADRRTIVGTPAVDKRP